MKHKAWIKTYEHDFERLAEEIGDLRYDSLAEFLGLLARKIKADAHQDRYRGRRHLSEALYETKDRLAKAADSIDLAWRICEPYMLPKDVMDKIKAEFTPEDQPKAMKLLLDFNRREYANNTFKLERCVLFGTEGDLKVLDQNIHAAKENPHDIILFAEYEGSERVRDLNFAFGAAERYNEEEEFPGTPDDYPF